jgi:hypothetical protein
VDLLGVWQAQLVHQRHKILFTLRQPDVCVCVCVCIYICIRIYTYKYERIYEWLRDRDPAIPQIRLALHTLLALLVPGVESLFLKNSGVGMSLVVMS